MRGRLSHYEYQCLVDQAPTMIWRSSLDGVRDYFNERWLSFRGRSPEQERGNGWLDGVHAEDRANCLATQKREAFELRFRLRHSEGGYRWVQEHGAPYFNASGEFQGYIGSCVDVTLDVEAAVALRTAREECLAGIRGVLPICCVCKKIRDEEGKWEKIETYISRHSSASFSHGLCPDCLKDTCLTEGSENGVRGADCGSRMIPRRTGK